MEELDSCHKQQHAGMTSEIKEEMTKFQKKVLTETVSRKTSVEPLTRTAPQRFHCGPLVSCTTHPISPSNIKIFLT